VLGHVGLADLKRYSAARKSTAGFPSQASDAASIYGAEQARIELPTAGETQTPSLRIAIAGTPVTTAGRDCV
jgi:hypothetical protein